MEYKQKAFSLQELKLPVISAANRKIKKGNYVAFFTRTMEWNPEKKCSVSKNQKLIGRLPLNTTTGKIVFTDEFIEQYPILKQYDVHRIDIGKYAAFKIDKRTKVAKQPPTSYDSLVFARGKSRFEPNKNCNHDRRSVGVSYSVDQIFEQEGITDALEQSLGKKQTNQLLSVVSFMVNESKSTFNDIEDIANFTWLADPTINNVEVTRLFQNINSGHVTNFQNFLTNNRLKKYKDDLYFVAVDGTSITSLSKDSDFAEYGKNKDNDPEKQINMMMITEQHSGIPIHCRIYPGNVPDCSSFSTSCRQLYSTASSIFRQNNHLISTYQKDRPDIAVVIDRGITSIKNICQIIDADFKVIGSLPTRRSSLATDAITAACNANIMSMDSDMCIQGDTPLYYYKHTIHTVDRGDIDLHVYFSLKVYLDTFNKLLEEATQALYEKEKDPTSTPELFKTNPEFFGFSKHTNTYTPKGSAISAKAKENAFRVLISNIPESKITPIEIYQAYKDRNACEVTFKDFKQAFGGNRFHTGQTNTLFGKILAINLAVIFKQIIKNKCKKALNKGNLPKVLVPYLTSFPKFVAVLKSIYATLENNKLYVDEIDGFKYHLFKILDIKLPGDTNQNYAETSTVNEKQASDYTYQDAYEEGLVIKNKPY